MTSPPYAVAIDLDGVVVDFISGFRDEVRRAYGVEIREEEITAHDLNLVLGVSRDEARDLVLRTLARDALALSSGAERGLRHLVDAGVEVHLVTSRASWQGRSQERTISWLGRRGINHPVHFASLDESAEGQKYAVAARLDCFVDDNIAELIGAMEHRGETRLLIVFDHPWNRCVDARSRLTRVRDWSSLVAAISAASGRHPHHG